MRLRNVRGAREGIIENDRAIKNYADYKGHWNEAFGNDNPIFIEIGMGKGAFIIEMATRYPDRNFVGIEKYSSVLIRALEKLEEGTLPNLLLIRMDAEFIEDVFAEEEVSGIYLNFSDPWPKDRHAGRRLTSDRFLERYTHILKKDGEIIFKTDNRALFDFSVETAKSCGWNILNITYDLHHSEYFEGNVMTEYEKKFSEMGNPIFRMVIKQ